MIFDILIVVREVAIKHKIMMQLEIALDIIVLSKLAITHFGSHHKILNRQQKISSRIIFKITKEIHSFLNTAKLKKPNRIIKINWLNSKNGFLLIQFKEDSAVLGIAVRDVDHVSQQRKHVRVEEELVVLFILIVAVFIYAVVVELEEVEVEVHAEVFLVLEERGVLVPD